MLRASWLLWHNTTPLLSQCYWTRAGSHLSYICLCKKHWSESHLTLCPFTWVSTHSGLFYSMRPIKNQRSKRKRTQRKTLVKIKKASEEVHTHSVPEGNTHLWSLLTCSWELMHLSPRVNIPFLISLYSWLVTVLSQLSHTQGLYQTCFKDGIKVIGIGLLSSTFLQPQAQEPNTNTSILSQRSQDTFWCECVSLQRSWGSVIHYELWHPNRVVHLSVNSSSYIGIHPPQDSYFGNTPIWYAMTACTVQH